MKRPREDNTVGIIQRAVKHYGLHVIKSTVKEALKSHPDYPTYNIIYNTINERQIENYHLGVIGLKAYDVVYFNNKGGQIGCVTDIDNEF